MYFLAHTVFAQNSVEGKISALTMQTLTAKLNEPANITLKGKKVKIIKKFNLSDTFGPKVSGEGSMDLGEGSIVSHQGNIISIKISKYYSTKVENGVTKPLANIGNKVVVKWE
jgi:hypothetical protein